MDYQTVTFQRIGGGETVEWRTADIVPATLAYLDHQGTLAAAEVFDPYTGKRRYYAPRTPRKAMAIIVRHLDKLGYKNRVAETTIDSTE